MVFNVFRVIFAKMLITLEKIFLIPNHIFYIYIYISKLLIISSFLYNFFLIFFELQQTQTRKSKLFIGIRFRYASGTRKRGVIAESRLGFSSLTGSRSEPIRIGLPVYAVMYLLKSLIFRDDYLLTSARTSNTVR